jgi:hypothetical protein
VAVSGGGGSGVSRKKKREEIGSRVGIDQGGGQEDPTLLPPYVAPPSLHLVAQEPWWTAISVYPKLWLHPPPLPRTEGASPWAPPPDPHPRISVSSPSTMPRLTLVVGFGSVAPYPTLAASGRRSPSRPMA